MAWSESLTLNVTDRGRPSELVLHGDDRFGNTVTLAREGAWSLPLEDVGVLRELGEWLLAVADQLVEQREYERRLLDG